MMDPSETIDRLLGRAFVLALLVLALFVFVYTFRHQLLTNGGLLHPVYLWAHWSILLGGHLVVLMVITGANVALVNKARRALAILSDELENDGKSIRHLVYEAHEASRDRLDAIEKSAGAFRSQAEKANAAYEATIEADLKRLLAALRAAETDYTALLGFVRDELGGLRADIVALAALTRRNAEPTAERSAEPIAPPVDEPI